jgi:hypothetical protein
MRLDRAAGSAVTATRVEASGRESAASSATASPCAQPVRSQRQRDSSSEESLGARHTSDTFCQPGIANSAATKPAHRLIQCAMRHKAPNLSHISAQRSVVHNPSPTRAPAPNTPYTTSCVSYPHRTVLPVHVVPIPVKAVTHQADNTSVRSAAHSSQSNVTATVQVASQTYPTSPCSVLARPQPLVHPQEAATFTQANKYTAYERQPSPSTSHGQIQASSHITQHAHCQHS